jgi:flagellar basal body-associated protein FliL
MAADENKNNANKDLPSIEDLIGSSSSPVAAPTDPSEETLSLDSGAVDRLLSKEDPDFAKKMKEIQDSEFSTSVAIEAVDIEAFLKEGESLNEKKAQIQKLKLKDRIVLQFDNLHLAISRLIEDSQNFALTSAKSLALLAKNLIKNIFKYSFGLISQFLTWLFHLPRRTKLIALGAFALALASALSLYISLKGHFLPRLDQNYLTGFADHADEVFEYKESDSKESFDSEIRHPEHMYEMERMIVNLRQNSEGEHIPMGLFEFYIATNSQDATVELGDRRTEARHIIERVIEQMTYEELVSPTGKGKLKFIVRKQLNDFLTKSHHVKQVYIKTFVLKP